MAAVLYRAAAELRRSVRGAAVIALLIALLGGVVLASVAGARRTASAYPRMLESTIAPELLVSPPGEAGADPTPFYEAIADLPGVRSLGVIAGLGYLPLAGSPTEALAERLSDFGEVATGIGAVDGVAGYELRRPVINAGRLPALDSTDEVLISRQMAKLTGLGLGDVLDVVLVGGVEVFQAAAEAGDGTPLRLEVVGLGTFANEVIPFSDLDEDGTFLVSPAVMALQERGDWAFEGAFVDLDEGVDVAAAVETISRLGAAEDAGTGGPVFISDETAQAGHVQDGMRPLALALVAVAVALGAVALVIVGQALSRHTRPSAGDHVAMRAVGFGAGQRAAVPLMRALAIGVVGAAGAAVVAIALSPRFPIGPARIAERDKGVDLDVPVLLLGSALVVLLTVLALVPAAVFRARRDRRRPPALGRLATSAAGSARLPAPEVQGVRLAFGAGPDGSPPARNAVVVAVLAVAAVLAAAAFARGLTALVDEPARYGQGWDVLVDSGFSPAPVAALVERLEDDPRIDGLAVGNYGELSVAGRPVPAVELAAISGSAGLTLVAGEVADDPGELVLGGEVLDALDLAIGDEVDVDAGEGAEQWRVVGHAVFPRLGRGSFDGTGLGMGAQVAPGPLDLLDVDDLFSEEGFDEADFTFEDRLYAFVALDVAGDVAPVVQRPGAARSGVLRRPQDGSGADDHPRPRPCPRRSRRPCCPPRPRRRGGAGSSARVVGTGAPPRARPPADARLLQLAAPAHGGEPRRSARRGRRAAGCSARPGPRSHRLGHLRRGAARRSVGADAVAVGGRGGPRRTAPGGGAGDRSLGASGARPGGPEPAARVAVTAAIGYWARRIIRRDAGAIVLLVLVVVVAAGGAMAAAAGARRSVTAADRLEAVSDVPEIVLIAQDEETFAGLTGGPEVAGVVLHRQLGLQPATTCDDESYFPIVVPVAGERFAIPRPRVISGRLSDPAAADEAVLSESHAHRLGVGVGDRIEYQAHAIDDGTGEVTGCAEATVAEVEVVGIVREIFEIGTEDDDGATLAFTYLTPAFIAAHPEVPDLSAMFGLQGFVDLAPGVGATRFLDEMDEHVPRTDGEPLAFGFPVGAGNPVQPALDATGVGLWALAGVTAAVGLAALAVGLARQVASSADDLRVLGAIGIGRRQLALGAAAPAMVVAAVGVPLALIVAAAASTFHLVGLARVVEPEPGFDVDPLVLAVGAAATLLIIVAIAARLSWQAAKRATRPAPVAVLGGRASPLRSRAGAHRRGRRSASPTPLVTAGRPGFRPGVRRSASSAVPPGCSPSSSSGSASAMRAPTPLSTDGVTGPGSSPPRARRERATTRSCRRSSRIRTWSRSPTSSSGSSSESTVSS